MGGPVCFLWGLFIALKLCGAIGWSWWWVMSPLWAPVLFALVVTVSTEIVRGVHAR